MDGSLSISDVLAEVGPRRKRVRTERDVAVIELAATTGIAEAHGMDVRSAPRRKSANA